MKNKLVLFLCGLLCFSNVIPVTAAEYTFETDNAKVPLLFTKESIFSVTLPESISGGNNKTVNFNYTVEGDIAANNKITINVEDNDTETEGIQLILSDTLGLTKKADISIEKKEFSYDEITDGLTKNGNVTFTDLTVGKWSGIAKFIIDMNIQEVAGIYDENGVLLCSWEDSRIDAEKNYSTYSDDDNYYQTSTASGYYVITNNYPTATKIVLPNTINHIGDYAFRGCTSLLNIVIPNSVENIGNYAFYNCTNIDDIVIPQSVTNIGNSAFSRCTNLSNIIIPNSVTTIGDDAFYRCTSLTNITIPDSVTSIGIEAFKESGLTSVSIPSSITSIKDYTFRGCTNLTTVEIPNSVTSIGNYAFYNCTNLTNIIIPDSVTSIGNYAFSNVPNINYNGSAIGAPWGALKLNTYIPFTLTSENYTQAGITKNGDVIIPETFSYNDEIYSIIGIDDTIFIDSSNITSISIPKSVTSINNYAFDTCPNLVNIYVDEYNPSYSSENGILFNKDKTKIVRYPSGKSETDITTPKGVTIIGADAYANCTNLKSITMSEDVTSIENNAFNKCTNLTNIIIPDSVTKIGKYAFWNCQSLINATIGNGVITIEDGAFLNCISLTNVTLGDSVANISSGAFNWCENLTNIILSENNPNFCSINGVVYNKNKTTLIRCPEGKTGTYTVPNSITKLENNAFFDCNKITNIELPNSLTEIGNHVFGYCQRLSNIIIPNNVTNIGYRAFMGCSLTSATFKETEGWFVGDNYGSKSIAISNTDLNNTTTAKTYLNSTYCNKYWSR